MDGHTHGACFYAQKDFNNKIDDIQEKLDHLKLEQAKYNQSKEIKTKQIVRYLILNMTIVIACICMHIVNFGMQLQKVMFIVEREQGEKERNQK